MPSATATVDSAPQAITYPRSTIATLSPHSYLLAHLRPLDKSVRPVRINGRDINAFRTPSCTTNSLTHCVGSAVVRLGDTAVVCGIQSEILLASSIADPPRPEDSSPELLARLNLLVPNVDLATGCSPANMPGGPPSMEAQTLAQRLYMLLLSSRLVKSEDLSIVHTPSRNTNLEEGDFEQQPATMAYWTLYASIHVLSLSGTSSLIDASWAALLAALRDVRLPRAWWDADLETVVCSDRVDESRRLNLSGSPLCCTWGIFTATKSPLGGEDGGSSREGPKKLGDGSKAWFLADPDAFEDPLCRETLTVVVDMLKGKTKVLKIEKNGGGALGVGDVKALTAAAGQRWHEWDERLPRP